MIIILGQKNDGRWVRAESGIGHESHAAALVALGKSLLFDAGRFDRYAVLDENLIEDFIQDPLDVNHTLIEWHKAPSRVAA